MAALPRSTDVFVIGGGPAGLAAAIAARRRGFDVTLADCSNPPIDKACGEGVMPDGVASALALGIDLRAAGGQSFRGIRFCERGASAEALFPNGFGLGLRRIALHRLMVDCAAQAGVRLVWDARVTGLAREGVLAEGRLVRARWIVGADGGQSSVRRWAGLDTCRRDSRRYAFRRHFRVAPWSEFMEIHWGDGCQLYITPVSASEICIVIISRDRRLRLGETLPQFPEVVRRLAGADPSTAERGGISATRTLKSVCRGRVVLCGDASGSVDAITGEGLCLLFQQAACLAHALAAGDLRLYQAAHRRLGRRPALMADLMLLMGARRRLRGRAIRALASQPRIFARMLSMHVGELSQIGFATNGLALGWHMLTL